MESSSTTNSRCANGRSRDSVVLVPVDHGYPKADLPESIRFLDRWLGPVGVLPIVLSGIFAPGLLNGVVAILAVWAGAFFLMRWMYGRHPPYRGVHLANDGSGASGRLTCYGAPSELAPLAQLCGYHFGPAVFVARKPTEGLALRDKVPGRTIVIESAKLIALLGLWYCQTPLIVIVAVALILFVGHPLLFSYLHTAYMRVSPQRLEILDAWLWRARPSRRRCIDLAMTSITCHYDKQELRIGADCDLADQLLVDLRSLDTPHAFVQCVFEAATCPESAPSLPDDAILG